MHPLAVMRLAGKDDAGVRSPPCLPSCQLPLHQRKLWNRKPQGLGAGWNGNSAKIQKSRNPRNPLEIGFFYFQHFRNLSMVMKKRPYRAVACGEGGRTMSSDSHATMRAVLLHDMRLAGENRKVYDTVQYLFCIRRNEVSIFPHKYINILPFKSRQ